MSNLSFSADEWHSSTASIHPLLGTLSTIVLGTHYTYGPDLDIHNGRSRYPKSSLEICVRPLEQRARIHVIHFRPPRVLRYSIKVSASHCYLSKSGSMHGLLAHHAPWQMIACIGQPPSPGPGPSTCSFLTRLNMDMYRSSRAVHEWLP